MKPSLHYSPAYDRLSPEEQKLLEEDVKLTEEAVKVSQKVNKQKHSTRNAHAKSFGFVRGNFIPVANEAADMCKLMGGTNLGVILRYSHPNFFVTKGGSEYPLYGCSVKIYNKNVPVSAKFPLVNLPVFITNSVSKFLNIHIRANKFFIATAKPFSLSFLKIPGLFMAGLRLFFDRELLSILRNMLKVLDIEKRFIATYAYHSVGCFRLENRVVKIRLRPTITRKTPEDPLMDQREAVQEYFLQHELSLDFQVQLGIDDRKTPVNNLLKRWREKDSKFITVGKIILPQQDVSRYETLVYENLSFNPFENSEALQPVGRMQRIRQKIYNTSVTTRQFLNKLK
ncbi:MAG: hypothetical protein K0M63_11850 [Weeksellaceae bacterium]|nr:hypothetical protein [Weeksellaceae bacterium]